MMFRKMTLALLLGAAMLLGTSTAAAADTTFPANTTVTYAPGSNATVVMLNTNLSAADRAKVTQYNIQVDIVGQAPRTLRVNSLPVTLFNIMPGTQIHAFLTLRGNFGASPTYDGGVYTQPLFGHTATPTAVPTPSSATPSPSTTPSTATTPTTSATPTTAPSSTTTLTTPKPVTQDDFWQLLSQHLPLALIPAIIAFLICGILYVRRRIQNR